MGLMVPLSEQDPARWIHPLLEEADDFLNRAIAIDRTTCRVLQARIHAAWCSRRDVRQAPPWRAVLALYDGLLLQRDDVVVRLNRVVAVAEVMGVERALLELASLDAAPLQDFPPFHAVRADLLRRSNRLAEARDAYDAAIERIDSAAERGWLLRQRTRLDQCRD
jgi:RNA polymerase sigma-70 factor (ECF subfamily)